MDVYLVLQLFSTTASIFFLVLLPFRLIELRKEKIKVVPGRHGHAKLMVAILLPVVQLIGLDTAAFPVSRFDMRGFSTIASLVASIGLCPLLFLEHSRSIKPSDLAVVYLLVSLACDSAELVTSAWETGTFSASLVMATACLRFVLLVTESRGKEGILRDTHGQWPPEQLAGVLSRTFFWWINSILARGNKSILTGDCLPPIDRELSSKLMRQRALRAWDQRAKPETKATLPKVLVQSMLSHFLAPIIPRLSLIVFSYAQPVLIRTAIRYMSRSSHQTLEAGYSVILMAVVVYVGLAVSRAVYYHRLNRLKITIRGAVVGLINNKLLTQRSSGYDDGIAVTLMSTDADNVGQSARMFHETWARVIEVGLGTSMLAREVGWACLVPFVIIFFCSRVSRYLAKNLQSKQKNWTVATQERLSMTTSMLQSMKGLKMLGIAADIESLLLRLRSQELDMAKKVRWMMVAYNASANALGIFSPIITFVIFVLLARLNGSTLDTETAFTTTALLGLVTHPANMIMTIIPQAVGSLAAFERIREYLLQPPRHDQRLTVKKTDNDPTKVSPAICVQGVTIQPDPSTPPILRDLNLEIDKKSIVVCAGPVGSGKTALAKALLGEVPTAAGTISVSSKRIGCCEQSPWLPNVTVKEAVCGFMPEDSSWYDQVVRLCCLDEDLLALPRGDDTAIGSRGLNLSGGQRQRVALARAIYSRCEIVILDDSFSALDGKTESQIVDNLLGPDGHFRKAGTTVFLITNSAAHFQLADWLVILGDSSITYQGTWSGLIQKPKNILKILADETQHGGSTEEQPQVNKAVQSQSLKVAEAVSDLSRATGDISLYGYYLHAVGFRNFIILLACTASYSLFVTFPQYWLQKWTEAPPSQTMFYIGGYLIVSFMAWISTSGSMWTTSILIAPVSGTELHRRLLSTIIGAPLSYFSVTDTGVTLNRFSQDIQLVDKQLPQAILSMSTQVFKLSVQTVLLFSAQKLMAITLPLCAIIVYLVQRVYLRTSRQLRLLDLESNSAVYSSFLESVEGVTTIRAFGWEKKAEYANIQYLEESQKPAYTLFCLQQWLGVVLDLMVAAIATGLITLAVLMSGTTTAGKVGMALNIVLVANATLLSLVTSWTNLEISLGAISRLKNLEAYTPKEDNPEEDYTPLESWPSSGVVELDNVTVAYNPEALALQDVTIKVSAGQQLVVCGRTGSGKSTLLLTLLRLLDPLSGCIKVDGLDLSIMPRSLVRQRCFITITQDPLIIGQASLRFNLDTSATLPDENIVAALIRVGIWTHFNSRDPMASATEAGKILDSSISSLPQMSTGQSQLFALARAVLRLQSLNRPANLARSSPDHARIMPILLLDEATSSVDPETESTMRSIIHEEFTEKGHTVISITHRLSGTTDNVGSDQGIIAFLSKGKVERVDGVGNALGSE